MANSSSFTLVFDKWLDESKISQSLINGFVDKVKDQQRNIKQKGLFEVSRTLRHIYVLCLCRSRTFSYFLLRSPALFEQGATFWAHSPSLSLTMEDANKVKKENTYHCARFSIVSQKVDFIWTEILPEYSYHLSINWIFLFCRRHANFSEKARFKFLRDKVSTLDPS